MAFDDREFSINPETGFLYTPAETGPAAGGRRWKGALRSLATLGMVFCVFVTLMVGLVFILHPRETVDFVQVLYLVKKDFREPLSVGAMLDGAIAGIAKSAQDPYTYFLTPDSNRAVAMSSQGLTGAIGVTVGNEKEMGDRLVIKAVQPGTGAAKAGLQAGDAILQVEDTPVRDITVDEAVAMIRGAPGTVIRLLIAREGEEEKEYLVNRSVTIPVETVQTGFLKDDYLPGYRVAYMFIDYFAGNTGGMFEAQLDGMLAEGAQALIIDLRYNGGGDVAAAAQIAGRLLPDGELMRLGMRDSEQIFRIKEANPVSIPYILLVNGGSASASEILAGAVQDREGGLLVGVRTYGKGSVQSLYNLFTGSGLRVTEGRYYLPSGRCIDGEGILPDYVVEKNKDEEDNQLGAALALMKELLDGAETLETLLAKSASGTLETH